MKKNKQKIYRKATLKIFQNSFDSSESLNEFHNSKQ